MRRCKDHMVKFVQCRTLRCLARIALSSWIIPAAVLARGQEVKPAASPQAAPDMTQTAPTIKVRVNLVEVRAVVRDQHGNVVPNLQQSDFKLFDDGKPQTISAFSVEMPPNAAANMLSSASGTPGTALPATLPDRFVALLFDDTHMSSGDAAATRKGTLALLDTLRPNERVALYTTSGAMTQEFTADKAELAKALDKLAPRPRLTNRTGDCPDVSYYLAKQVDLLHDDGAFQVIFADAWRCAYQNDPHMQHQAEMLARSAVQQAMSLGKADINFVYDHIQGVVERLSAMPGRKTMVFLSPGISLDEDSARLSRLIDEANRLGVVINTLDARGLFTSQTLDASRNIPSSPSAQQYARQQQLDNGVFLSDLAEGTGGIHFQNSNDIDGAMKRIAGTPEVTYILLFTPNEAKKKETFHKLKVELVQNGAHYDVKARNGYYTEKRPEDAQKLAEQEIASALSSPKAIQEMPLELFAKFTKADPSEVTVVTRLGIKDVTFRKQGDRRVNEIQIETAFFDVNGITVLHQEKTVQLNLTDTTYQNFVTNGLVMHGEFAIKPGNYVVRQVIREQQEGKIAMQSGSVEWK